MAPYPLEPSVQAQRFATSFPGGASRLDSVAPQSQIYELFLCRGLRSGRHAGIYCAESLSKDTRRSTTIGRCGVRS